jgi:PadR family transcriptional regulator, regulatory protein AphA
MDTRTRTEHPAATVTTTEAAVLGLLTWGEMSGYDLRKMTERSVGYFWAPAKTQIYTVLPRLVETGLATRRQVLQSDRPDKQLYRITKQGRRALREWLEHGPLEPVPDKNPILLKLFFGASADPDALVEQVAERREAAVRLRRELEEIEASISSRSADEDFFPALTRRWGYVYADALEAWATEVERAIERRKRRGQVRARTAG